MKSLQCHDYTFFQVSFSPTTPRFIHIKLLSLLCVIVVSCCGLLAVCAMVGLQMGLTIFAFMAAEVIIFMQYFCLKEIGRKRKTCLINPSPSATKSYWPLPPAVWPGYILFADQLQALIMISVKLIMESSFLISLKMVIDISKNGRWLNSWKKLIIQQVEG